MERLADQRDAPRRVGELAAHLPLREAIVRFWRDPGHRGTTARRVHVDINEVMLATALVPSSVLALPDSARSGRPGPDTGRA